MEDQHGNSEGDEEFIIHVSYSVIQPFSVVVEVGHAAVTLPSVLGVIRDVALTYFAIKRETFGGFWHPPFYYFISWIHQS